MFYFLVILLPDLYNNMIRCCIITISPPIIIRTANDTIYEEMNRVFPNFLFFIIYLFPFLIQAARGPFQLFSVDGVGCRCSLISLQAVSMETLTGILQTVLSIALSSASL